MATTGHESETINVQGLKASLQKLKTDIINGKYSKPSGGIPASDLASGVQTSLGKADSALQSHQSVTDNNPTLAWGTKSKVGTVGSTELNVTMPAKPSYSASDVGLGNVGNFKAVSTEVNQGLSSTEQSNARANIGAGTSSFSGSYNDLSNKPSLGSAAYRGATDTISSGNTDLVTSGAVYTMCGNIETLLTAI